jgi:hypothetical protein
VRHTVPTQRVVATVLVVFLTAGSLPAFGQVTSGTIAGKATDEAKKPYSDYVVQLRDVATGLVANTQPLDPQGQFGFLQTSVPGTYLVELVKVNEKKIVCTEGPYALNTAKPSKLDVNINCGKAPAAIWLLAAGAAAAIAVAKRSNSK